MVRVIPLDEVRTDAAIYVLTGLLPTLKMSEFATGMTKGEIRDSFREIYQHRLARQPNRVEGLSEDMDNIITMALKQGYPFNLLPQTLAVAYAGWSRASSELAAQEIQRQGFNMGLAGGSAHAAGPTTSSAPAPSMGHSTPKSRHAIADRPVVSVGPRPAIRDEQQAAVVAHVQVGSRPVVASSGHQAEPLLAQQSSSTSFYAADDAPIVFPRVAPPTAQPEPMKSDHLTAQTEPHKSDAPAKAAAISPGKSQVGSPETSDPATLSLPAPGSNFGAFRLPQLRLPGAKVQANSVNKRKHGDLFPNSDECGWIKGRRFDKPGSEPKTKEFAGVTVALLTPPAAVELKPSAPAVGEPEVGALADSVAVGGGGGNVAETLVSDAEDDEDDDAYGSPLR